MDYSILKDKYTIDDLKNILVILRSENGCPWDKVQTHQSIKKDMIEEAYEAIDALDANNDELFANELGDVLLQVAFHSQIASERGAFDFDRVLYELCTKLITRHTHVFGEEKAKNADEALKTWNANKKKETKDDSDSKILNDIPHHLPSLIRAEKVQKKAVSFGVNSNDISSELDNIKKLSDDLKSAAEGKDEASSIYRKLLFSITNVGRLLKTPAETELADETNHFIKAFEEAEKQNTVNNLTI